MNNKLDDYTIEDIYYLETLEQMEAFANSIRQKMIKLLTFEPKTAAQLARDLGISRPKAHYHLKVLEKIGFAYFVGEVLVNGIMEKYFISRARFFSFDKLIEHADEHPEDHEYLKKYSQITNRFHINLLEISRERLLQEGEKHSLDDFSFDYGCRLSSDQFKEVNSLLQNLSDKIRNFTIENRDREDYESMASYRSILLLLASPQESSLIKTGNDEKELQE